MKKLLLISSFFAILSPKSSIYIKGFISSGITKTPLSDYHKEGLKKLIQLQRKNYTYLDCEEWLCESEKESKDKMGINANLGIEWRYGDKLLYVPQFNIGLPGQTSFSFLGIGYKFSNNDSLHFNITFFIHAKDKKAKFPDAKIIGVFFPLKYNMHISKYDSEVFIEVGPYNFGNSGLSGLMGSIGVMKKIY